MRSAINRALAKRVEARRSRLNIDQERLESSLAPVQETTQRVLERLPTFFIFCLARAHSSVAQFRERWCIWGLIQGEGVQNLDI